MLRASCIFSLVALASNAWALGGSTFKDRIDRTRRSCPTLTCTTSPIQIQGLSTQERRSLNPQLREQLRGTAFELTQLWGDTILEGDYVAHHSFRLDDVAYILENQQVLGYRITYSSKAWYVGNCNYDEMDRSSLKSCDEGRIFESAFVSADFQDAFVDRLALAEFVDARAPLKRSTQPEVDPQP